jgi:Protein of unknown function (DUF3500)
MAEFIDRKHAAADCSDCASVSRRDFVRTIGAGALAATVPLIGRNALAAGTKMGGGPTPSAPAETAVGRFYKSLTPEQRKLICFPFDNPLRKTVKNNWDIVKPGISDLKPEQQQLCREIMKNLCSEDGYERFMRQMQDDDGGFENYHVAVFGEPATDKPFEWVLTGRHDTLRADGNSVEGAAFGGPIFYGHAADGHDNEDAKHTNNVWWYQGEQANKIFQSFDDKQKAQCMIPKSPADEAKTIKLKGSALPATGILIADLDNQQKVLVKELVDKMLLPFRACDGDEVRACLESNGGVSALRLSFSKEGDIGNDGVWDIWKLEGPTFSWFFRGSPHVHTWLNVASKA